MNSYTLKLSSTNTSNVSRLGELNFDDYTTLKINLQAVTESVVPLYMKIDWGTGSEPIIYDNDLYRDNVDERNLFKFSPILNASYSYEYYPSSYALYKSLSAQVLIQYVNGDYSWFIIPIRIRTFDYLESLSDVKLINSNILSDSNDSIEYQFRSIKDNQLFELRND